jgi:chemotaxis response regulator CheB
VESGAPWIVAVGASGREGLDDLKDLLFGFPTSLPAVVMLVLHRPWERPSYLKSVLEQTSPLPLVIAADGERLELGTAYIGSPAEHLTLAANTFGKLLDDPDRLFRNRTVDLLFKSVAIHAGPKTIGVVLSGSLDDGSRGLAMINHAGGLTMVMTPETHRRSPGMPENAIDYDGPVDVIGNASQIAAAIKHACLGHVAPPPH